MLSDLMEFKYKFEDAIENVVAPIKTVNDETPLGKICAILQVEKFVLVETGKHLKLYCLHFQNINGYHKISCR